METGLHRFAARVERELDGARRALQRLESSSADSGAAICDHLRSVGQALEARGYCGASLLVGEMHALALEPGAAQRRRETCDSLQVCLDRLRHDLAPSRLQCAAPPPLVMLNDLRALRGAPLLSESVVFELGSDWPAHDPPAAGPAWTEAEVRALAPRLRPFYQKGLVAWLRGDDRREGMQLMQAVLARLGEVCEDHPVGRFWWVAGGYCESVAQGTAVIGTATKRLLAALDLELKRFADTRVAALRRPGDAKLMTNLLFYVERSEASGERLTAIRSAFALSHRFDLSKLATERKERALAEVRGDLYAVAQLLRARDGEPSRRRIAEPLEVLERAADALALLELAVPRSLVLEQLEVLRDTATGEGSASAPASTETAARLHDIIALLVLPENEVEGASDSSVARGAQSYPRRRTGGDAVRHRLEHELRQVRAVLQRLERHPGGHPPDESPRRIHVRVSPEPVGGQLDATAAPRRASASALDLEALARRIDGLSDPHPADVEALPIEVEASSPPPPADIETRSGGAESVQALVDDGVAVDAALLENLSAVVGAIGQTRTRAEHRVADLRGGLEDMGDTVRELKSYLRRIELQAELHAATPSAPPAGRAPLSESALANLGERLQALSSGLDTLAGMHDTFESLAGETESLLSRQAREHGGLSGELARSTAATAGAESRVLLVEASGENLALPLDGVEAVVRRTDHRGAGGSARSWVEHEGYRYPLHYLGTVLGFGEPPEPAPADAVVLIAHDHHRAALLVDEIHGRELITVRSLGPQLDALVVVRGAGLRVDEAPMLILDPVQVLKLVTGDG